MTYAKSRNKLILILITLALIVTLGFVLSSCNYVSMKIEFVVDGESIGTSDISSGSFDTPTPPELDGFDFYGWYLDEGDWEIELTKDYIEENSDTDETITVYAYYTESLTIIILPNITFESKTFQYDGEEHLIEIAGSLNVDMTVSSCFYNADTGLLCAFKLNT